MALINHKFSVKEHKTKILGICHRLYDKNMLAAADGNVSVKIKDKILITSSGVAKGFATEDDFALIALNGDVIQGTPSTESQMHLRIYQSCTKATAVIHAHPPHAIAWSIAKPELAELPTDSLSEVILAIGRIPIAKFAIPGSDNLADSLLPFLPNHRGIIMSRHGAVTWGESLAEAMNGMERIEHAAMILAIAEKLGGAKKLPEKDLMHLFELRKRIGEHNL